jgi:hypothetical protein
MAKADDECAANLESWVEAVRLDEAITGVGHVVSVVDVATAGGSKIVREGGKKVAKKVGKAVKGLKKVFKSPLDACHALGECYLKQGAISGGFYFQNALGNDISACTWTEKASVYTRYGWSHVVGIKKWPTLNWKWKPAEEPKKPEAPPPKEIDRGFEPPDYLKAQRGTWFNQIEKITKKYEGRLQAAANNRDIQEIKRLREELAKELEAFTAKNPWPTR